MVNSIKRYTRLHIFIRSSPSITIQSGGYTMAKAVNDIKNEEVTLTLDYDEVAVLLGMLNTLRGDKKRNVQPFIDELSNPEEV